MYTVYWIFRVYYWFCDFFFPSPIGHVTADLERTGGNNLNQYNLQNLFSKETVKHLIELPTLVFFETET